MIPFRTVSGKRVDLEHPRPEDVDVRDIACGLSKVCRFTGQLRRFYSVAEHSSFVALLVPEPLRRAALLHDASEAYLNDLSRNLKHSKYLVGYRIIEDRWRVAVNMALGCFVDPDEAQLIKFADDLASVWERVVVRKELNWETFGGSEITQVVREGWVRTDAETLRTLATKIPEGWSPIDCYAAEARFLRDYAEYTG